VVETRSVLEELDKARPYEKVAYDVYRLDDFCTDTPMLNCSLTGNVRHAKMSVHTSLRSNMTHTGRALLGHLGRLQTFASSRPSRPTFAVRVCAVDGFSTYLSVILLECLTPKATSYRLIFCRLPLPALVDRTAWCIPSM